MRAEKHGTHQKRPSLQLDNVRREIARDAPDDEKLGREDDGILPLIGFLRETGDAEPAGYGKRPGRDDINPVVVI